MRFHGTRPGPFAICNRCSDQKKRSSVSYNPTTENITQEHTTSNLPDSEDDSNLPMEFDIENEELIYELDDLEELVATRFQDYEENGHIEFSVTIELSDEFVEGALSNEIDRNNVSKEGFRHIIDTLLISIQAGSQYYWELKRLYLNTKADGCAGAYLYCSQRIERQHKRPDDQPVKRISEARPAIERFPCLVMERSK